jgi:putative PIN family toxin of toxin-antitoxin system
MIKNPTVVLDTNIILVSISSKSKYHKIFTSLLDGNFNLCVTNEILLEYEEIITQRFNKSVAINTIRTLLLLTNVKLITPYFKWQLIKDVDDNKFVDCYVASNSSILVTNDKDFDILSTIKFPKIKIVDIENFISLL